MIDQVRVEAHQKFTKLLGPVLHGLTIPVKRYFFEPISEFSKGLIAMSASSKSQKPPSIASHAESEGGMWDSEDNQLLDPRVIEPRMYLADQNNDSGWGFHRRAEILNGRLAMLGFVIGLVVEMISGQGILQQIGLGALLHHG